jgi:hypothetical protein
VTAPGSSTQDSPTLCVADGETFWAWHSSPRIGTWPNAAATVVVIPLAGMAEWGLGHPLDAEETVLMSVLRDACRLVPREKRPLVVPPLRFAFGADPSCAFAVDQTTAQGLIAEVAASIAAAGFRKIVIVNASPWNEELCSAAARDLRVSRGLNMFQIHLSAIGLDFHPVRGRSRRNVQTLLTALYEREPEPAVTAEPGRTAGWGEEPVLALAGPAIGLKAAGTEGAAILAVAAGRLAGLLSDIHDRAPLTVRITPT